MVGPLLVLAAVSCTSCQQAEPKTTAVSSPQPAPTASAENPIDTALKTARQRPVGEAITLLSTAVAQFPDEPRLVEELSRALLSTGQVSEAYRVVAAFNRAHLKGALAAEGFRILGNFYATVRSQVDALAALKTAVTLDSQSGPAWRDLALAREYFPNGASTGSAIEAAEKAVALLPGDATALLTMARLQKRLASPEARSYYQKAVAAAPARADIHRQFAEWLMQYGKDESDLHMGLQEAETSLQTEPRSPLGLLLVGQAKLRLKDAVGAIAALKEAARLSPNVPKPASLLAQAHQVTGNRTEYLRWRKEADARTAYQNEVHRLFAELSTRPGDRKLMGVMATLIGNHGEISEAVRYKAMALDAAPDSATVLTAVAKDLRAGKYTAAAEALEKRAALRATANNR